MNFSAYLEKEDPKHHDVLQHVNDLLLRSHPGVRLLRKWGLPVYELKKNIAYLDVQKDRPLLGIMYARDINGILPLLHREGRKQVGHFYLDTLTDDRYAELLTVIDLAITHDLTRDK
jgi:hypothetical protein